MFVLDEADEMLSRGFKDQIYDIFQLLPPKLQVSQLWHGVAHTQAVSWAWADLQLISLALQSRRMFAGHALASLLAICQTPREVLRTGSCVPWAAL